MAITEKRTESSTLHPNPARKNLSALDWLAVTLVVVGGINWSLVGLFDFDLVAFMFGAMTSISRVVYVVVAIAALYAIYSFARLSAARH